MLSLEKCYDHCRKIALGHYENFPVGSLLVPKHLQKHIYALYAFMRTADDVADDPTETAASKLSRLHEIRTALDAGSSDPIILAVRHTLDECRLDRSELHLLLDAFDFDATGEVRFDTFDDLRWYTARSAEPVGRLVLALFGYKDPDLIGMSNEITSALQLLNFVQDAQEDLAMGRCYFPKADYENFDISSVAEIEGQRAADLLAFEGQRVRAMLEAGAALPEQVEGRLRYELRVVILSANELLRKMAKAEWSHLSAAPKPRLTKARKSFILLKALLGPVRMAPL